MQRAVFSPSNHDRTTFQENHYKHFLFQLQHAKVIATLLSPVQILHKPFTLPQTSLINFFTIILPTISSCLAIRVPHPLTLIHPTTMNIALSFVTTRMLSSSMLYLSTPFHHLLSPKGNQKPLPPLENPHPHPPKQIAQNRKRKTLTLSFVDVIL